MKSLTDSVWNSVWAAVHYSVCQPFNDYVWKSDWDYNNSLGDYVEDFVYNSVRDSVSDSVSDSVRNLIHENFI